MDNNTFAADDDHQDGFLFDSLNSFSHLKPAKSEDKRDSMQATLKQAIVEFEQEKEQKLRH